MSRCLWSVGDCAQVGRYPPEPEKDKFWEQSVPCELPYTIASLPFRTETPLENQTCSRGGRAPIYLSRGNLRPAPSLTSVVSSIRSDILQTFMRDTRLCCRSAIAGPRHLGRQSSNASLWSVETGGTVHSSYGRRISLFSETAPRIGRLGALNEQEIEPQVLGLWTWAKMVLYKRNEK